MSGAAFVALIVAVAGCGGSGVDSADVKRCAELGEGKLRAGSVTVYLAKGTVPSCGDNTAATRAFLAAHDALASVLEPLRPSPVVIVMSDDVDAIETDREAGAIHLAEHPSRPVDRAAWLHELSHLASLGPRPKGILGGRLADALDEGVADYYAARAMGSPVVGPRDLSQPPRDAGAAWAALPMPDARFDPHPLGHAFGAALWKRQPEIGDLLVCMRAPAGWGDGDAPRAVLASWVAGCPARSRVALRSALADWAPAPMLPAEGEAHVEEKAQVVR